MAEMLYPSENPMVERRSSIGQFKNFLAVIKKGGWAPIVFDMLDYIDCDKVKTHPVAITFGDDSYIYPEGRCIYENDTWVTVDKRGVEEKLLPECFGGQGETYETFVDSNSFVNFDDSALGVHNKTTLRVGTSYVKCDETLPFVD